MNRRVTLGAIFVLSQAQCVAKSVSDGYAKDEATKHCNYRFFPLSIETGDSTWHGLEPRGVGAVVKKLLCSAMVISGVLALNYFMSNYVARYVPKPVASENVHDMRSFVNDHIRLLPL